MHKCIHAMQTTLKYYDIIEKMIRHFLFFSPLRAHILFYRRVTIRDESLRCFPMCSIFLASPFVYDYWWTAFDTDKITFLAAFLFTWNIKRYTIIYWMTPQFYHRRESWQGKDAFSLFGRNDNLIMAQNDWELFPLSAYRLLPALPAGLHNTTAGQMPYTAEIRTSRQESWFSRGDYAWAGAKCRRRHARRSHFRYDTPDLTLPSPSIFHILRSFIILGLISHTPYTFYITPVTVRYGS